LQPESKWKKTAQVTVSFNSLQYQLFLPIVLAVYWLIPHRFRLIWLLVASYIFYMSWKPAYGMLMLGLTVANFYLVPCLTKLTKHKTKLFAFILTINLVALFVFKYANFAVDSYNGCLSALSLPWHKLHLSHIILPLGISFFVFEFIHYAFEVYRGRSVIKSFPAFALFAAFFPTQISGPIKRYQDFLPQFLRPATFSLEKFERAIFLLLTGFSKKLLIADQLSSFVQSGFQFPNLFSGMDLWLVAYAFAFQIYFDFSGYTDIARGSALLFGFEVPINFNLPYLAANISDFWRRWHISLSTWLKDYLFIPLGGSHGGRWSTWKSLMVTMVLGGLWHGAAIHFAIWGFYHGLLLVVHRELKLLIDFVRPLRKFIASDVGHALSVFATFQAVCLGWILFRMEDMNSGWIMLRKMLFLNGFSTHLNMLAFNYPPIFRSIYLILILLFGAQLVFALLEKGNQVPCLPRPLKAAWCAVMLSLLLVFSPDTSPRFIYFQF
jgi:D-alanyl-lipoteichoic acid acyltransferase DltB (MBOAT superfamily)